MNILTIVWLVSLGLSLLSIATMFLLLIRRTVSSAREMRRQKQLQLVRRGIVSHLTEYDPQAMERFLAQPVVYRYLAEVGAQLLRRLRGAEAELLVAILEGFGCIDAFVKNARAGDAVTRLAALDVLERFTHPDAERALTRLLSDPDQTVRLAAATSLIKKAHLPHMEDLVRCLDLEENVITPALKHFFRALVTHRLDIVRDLIRRIDSEAVHLAAVEAMGRSGDYRVLTEVVASLQDRRIRVRLAAVLALGHLDHPKALKILAHTRDQNSSTTVRRAAEKAHAWALARNSGEAQTGPGEQCGWWSIYEWQEDTLFTDRLSRLHVDPDGTSPASQVAA